MAVFGAQFRVVGGGVARGALLVVVGGFEFFDYLAPGGEADGDFVIVVALEGQAAFFDLAVEVGGTEGEVGLGVVAGAAAGDGVFDFIGGGKQVGLADCVAGIKALLPLFLPEDVAEDVGVGGVRGEAGFLEPGAGVFPEFLARFLPFGERHAGVAVVDAAGEFDVDAGAGVDASRFAQEIDLLAQDGERALHEGVAEHAEVDGGDGVARVNVGIGGIGLAVAEIELVELP